MTRALQLVHVVAEILGVPDAHRVAFPALHGRRDVVPPDGHLDDLVQVLDFEPETRDLVPPGLDVDVIPSRDALSVNAQGALQLLEGVLDIDAHTLDGLEVASQDLDADGSPHPRGEHVDAVDDGHGDGVGIAGELQGLVHVVQELFLCHALAPLVLRFQQDGRLHHGKRRGVQGSLGPPRLSEDPFHFREALDDPVLGLQDAGGLRHRNARQGGGHI